MPMRKILNRIRYHLSNPRSHNRRIAAGFLWVSLFVFVGKLVGAGKEMAMAWRYGVSEKVDAYVFMLSLVTLPISVWLGILTMILVPLASRVAHENPTELAQFRREFLGMTVIIAIILGAIAAVALPWLISSTWMGLTDGVIVEASGMLSSMIILIPVGLIISLFSVWLLAAGRHQNTLYEATPALVVLVALLLPYGWIPEPLLWGTVGGFSLHLFMLTWNLKGKHELQLPQFSRQSTAWQGFWAGMGITAAGQFIMSLTALVDQFFIAGLGPGALASVSYANRFVALIIGMVGMAIGRAVLPIFSEVNIISNNQLAKMALNWSKLIFIGSFIITLFIWPMADVIIRILFERGAFSSENTRVVAQLLKVGLIQIPFYTSGLVLVFALSSAKKYHIIAIVAFINLMVKIIFTYIFTMEFGESGVFLSNAVMYANALFLFAIAVIYLKNNEFIMKNSKTI
jgi:putative peptidoglycan lipid II flippase